MGRHNLTPYDAGAVLYPLSYNELHVLTSILNIINRGIFKLTLILITTFDNDLGEAAYGFKQNALIGYQYLS